MEFKLQRCQDNRSRKLKPEVPPLKRIMVELGLIVPVPFWKIVLVQSDKIMLWHILSKVQGAKWGKFKQGVYIENKAILAGQVRKVIWALHRNICLNQIRRTLSRNYKHLLYQITIWTNLSQWINQVLMILPKMAFKIYKAAQV